jgi:tetratricopeptide (TPR) repeat protein
VNSQVTNDDSAVAALVRDLHWQIDQLKPRGIKDKTGNPYDPAYYKRGLQKAIDRGGLAVADYVRQYLYKSPSDGYKKLEAADALDLACEYLVADAERPYAHLFSDEDRAAAEKRLAPHLGALAKRKADREARIERLLGELPDDLGQLQALAAETTLPEDAVAINSAIIQRAPDDVVALNRLGRAYDALGKLDLAESTFRAVIEIDPGNSIARGRLRGMTGSWR